MLQLFQFVTIFTEHIVFKFDVFDSYIFYLPFPGSLFSRYQEISDNLAEIYRKAKRTDCTMKVDGHNIRVHRMILETRSSIFAAMFNHDTKENQTGEIPIDDIEEKVMDAIVVIYVLRRLQ